LAETKASPATHAVFRGREEEVFAGLGEALQINSDAHHCQEIDGDDCRFDGGKMH